MDTAEHDGKFAWASFYEAFANALLTWRNRRDELVKAMQKIGKQLQNNEIDIENITENLISNSLYTAGQPDPDLLIRPGGEQRISNYLLWQLAYTEFLFVKKYWPEFSEQDLDEAIKTFTNRNRKFGGK